MRTIQTVLGVIIWTVLVTGAYAHDMRPAYLRLKEVEKDVYSILLKTPSAGDQLKPGLTIQFPEGTEHLVEPAGRTQAATYVERFRIRSDGGLTGKTIHINGLASTMTDVLVRIAHLDGSIETLRITPDSPSLVVQGIPTTLGVAKSYTMLGIEHIWSGIDHLLFVACLILVAGTGRRILITITGFTIAHSITLALAALQVIQIPTAPVEACIALSIVFLATEIVRNRRNTLTWRYPITVSTAFGLLHGFGFASALGEVGLPQTAIPASLLCFNVGVEIGQILFVLGVVVLLRVVVMVRRDTTETAHRFMGAVAMQKISAYVIGSTASFWMIQRMAGF